MIDRWFARLRAPRYGVVVLTTATALLMGSHWRPMVLPGAVVVVLLLRWPEVAVRPLVWAIVAALWTGAVLLGPVRMEDHVYLFVAWLVALTVALMAASEEGFLERAAWQARVLIGIAFTAAAAWKLAFGEFLDGSVLWTLFVIDSRFGPLAAAVGLSTDAVASTRSGLVDLLAGTVEAVPFEASSSVVARIVVLAVATLLLEAVVAASYLAGDDSRLARLRLPSLSAFAVLTYAVVPVLLFASLLAVLGMVTARWRPTVLWVYPAFVLVASARLLVLDLT